MSKWSQLTENEGLKCGFESVNYRHVFFFSRLSKSSSNLHTKFPLEIFESDTFRKRRICSFQRCVNDLKCLEINGRNSGLKAAGKRHISTANLARKMEGKKSFTAMRNANLWSEIELINFKKYQTWKIKMWKCHRFVLRSDIRHRRKPQTRKIPINSI